MKRDWPLIRKILLWVISQPQGGIFTNPAFEGHTKEEVNYHVSLMKQAGFIEAEIIETIHPGGPDVIITGVTNAGHDFAEKIADETTWNKIWKAALSTGKEITIDLLKKLATSLTLS